MSGDQSWLNLCQETRPVLLPVHAQFFDGPGEVGIGVSPKDRRLVLCPIWVNGVAVTKTVGIVVPDNGLPLVLMPDFQLHHICHNLPAQPLITTTNVGFARPG